MSRIKQFQNFNKINENKKDTPLLDIIRSYNYEIFDIKKDKSGISTSINFPRENNPNDWYSFTMYKIFTIDDIDEGIQPGEEGWEDILAEYKGDIGKPIVNQFRGDTIEWRAYLPNINNAKLNTDYMKEAGLLYAQKELITMMYTVLEKDITNTLTYNDIMSGESSMKLLGLYLDLNKIYITDNKKLQWLPSIAYRLYKNSKLINIVLDENREMLEKIFNYKYN